jgi:hypothetical protein
MPFRNRTAHRLGAIKPTGRIQTALFATGKKEKKFEEFCLLGHNAVQSVEREPAFRKNISPPSSGRTRQEIVVKAGGNQ